MKCLVIALAMTVGLLVLAPRASAHVLVTDQTGQKGAILHIVPDDDPIAGKEATLFLDTQNDLLDGVSTVLLFIGENSTPVEVKVDGSLATADYTFPAQGVYPIRYEVQTPGGSYVFEQTIRISRGVTAGDVERPRHTWAEGLLIGSAVLFACLAIIAWNHRAGITRQSTF